MRKSTDGAFVQVDREIALDPNLSAKAKGLYLLLGALDSSAVNVAGIVRVSADGEASVKRGLLDLEQAGYLTREKVRDGNGRLIGSRYVTHGPKDAQRSA